MKRNQSHLKNSTLLLRQQLQSMRSSRPDLHKRLPSMTTLLLIWARRLNLRPKKWPTTATKYASCATRLAMSTMKHGAASSASSNTASKDTTSQNNGVPIERLLATVIQMLKPVLILGMLALVLVHISKAATRQPAMDAPIVETSRVQSCWDDYCLNPLRPQ